MARAVKRGDTYVLELTKDEARAIHMVTYAVGGDPKLSLRGEIDEIRQSLMGAGIKYEDSYGKHYTGDITFLAASKEKTE
jgi:hypothetical protein